MARIFGIIILILSILFFPPAVMALISNNAVPGDVTYPIKRKLEEGILLVASISPTTKAWFSVTRSNRRFDEAKTLLAQGKVADQTLDELVSQTDIAASQILQFSDTDQKKEYIEQLSASITKYQQELRQVSQNNTPTARPTSAATTATIKPTTLPSQATAVSTTAPTRAPSALPTSTPVAVTPPTPVPPAPPPQPPSPPGNVGTTIDDLDDIKKRIEEEKRKLQQSQMHQSKEQREERREQRRGEQEERGGQDNKGNRDGLREGGEKKER